MGSQQKELTHICDINPPLANLILVKMLVSEYSATASPISGERRSAMDNNAKEWFETYGKPYPLGASDDEFNDSDEINEDVEELNEEEICRENEIWFNDSSRERIQKYYEQNKKECDELWKKWQNDNEHISQSMDFFKNFSMFR
jgi:hypothetical protein